MSYEPPQLSIISTPVQHDDDDETDTKSRAPFTPSPQAVDEIYSTAITSANRSDVVSKMLSDHLVTVNDEEVIISSATVTLPELDLDDQARVEDHYDYDGYDSSSDTNSIRPSPANSPLITNYSRHRIPPPQIDIQKKMLYQSISSIASPIRAEDFMPQLHVGPERSVYFHQESLGIKISRHTDGYVRVLSVAPYRSATKGSSEKVREGQIYEGDVVREVSDVNLRMPIDSAVWKLTVGLVKMAPRPLTFVVARELDEELQEEEEDGGDGDVVGNHVNTRGSGGSSINHPTRAMIASEDPSTQQPLYNTQPDPRFGPTREIHFFQTALGVKLHHNSEGYVQILSVTPYKSFPDSPMERTGDIKAGDVVLEVGGVWDLREPLVDDTSWGVLVKFIRETRRPLCMVVADGESLSVASSTATTASEEGEEENEYVQSVEATLAVINEEEEVDDEDQNNSNGTLENSESVRPESTNT